MLVTSRSFEEYVAMFGLGESQLAGRVLDCAAGASSFAATAATRGCRTVAVDPAYALPRQQLAEQARADLARGAAIAGEHADRFTWSWYGTAEDRDRMRTRALATFVQDLVLHPSRYVAAQLPALPFADGAFDLALCSHLLFTWADQLGMAWHAAALHELVRVAGEVRVFPTVLQGAGDPVPFWDELMARLHADGLRPREVEVPFEFQVGARRMLLVSR